MKKDYRSTEQLLREKAKLEKLIEQRMAWKQNRSKLTQQRQGNLSKAFPSVQWDFEKAELLYFGAGDYPRFKIMGTCQDFTVEYVTKSPAGSNSWLKIYRDGKKVFHRNPAPIKKAQSIWHEFECQLGRTL